MAAAREYELVLMLDPGQDAPARDAIAQEARGQIESSGTLKHQNDWGLRKLAYEIGQRNEADYRWFRFEAPADLLEQLDHSLKIAAGVLRFRIFKVDEETPVMVPPATTAPGPGSRERPGEDLGEIEALPGGEAPPAEAPEAPPAAEAPEAPPAEIPPQPVEPTPADEPEGTPSAEPEELPAEEPGGETPGEPRE